MSQHLPSIGPAEVPTCSPSPPLPLSIVLLLIKMMAEYCQCATDLPTLAYDVMGKLVDIMTVSQGR